jgi:hypothetical protein
VGSQKKEALYVTSMADLLPFPKRDPPLVHPCPERDPPKPFDQVIFHIPVNRQMIHDRDYQEGALKQIEMKTKQRNIDGRLDQCIRNRMNMFRQNGFPILDPTTSRRPALDRATRHCNTPYGYSTRWISHPPTDSAMAPIPEEIGKTSYLATPNADNDHIKVAQHTESKYNALRWNERKFRETVARADRTIVQVHEKNMRDIRAQRAAHLTALDERHKLEHYHFFE